ncbi:hypothetical protein H8356DRAFT_1073957 [Neocallimastix lanati (nom. inval.)]|nr:hypothetical protein H8356DRAFT_1073957 [Neocallimastix sp. JGI-2020a]
MSGNDEVIKERVLRILNYLSEFMKKYDSANLDLAEIKTGCEVKNFFKISKKYDHVEYFQNMIQSFAEKKPDDKIEVGLGNFVKKIVYQDDKLTDAVGGTSSKYNVENMNMNRNMKRNMNFMNFMNYVEEKKNEHQQIKIKKEITSAIEENLNNRNNSKKINATTRNNATTKTNVGKDKNKERKKAAIGRPVKLRFKLDTFNNVKGEIYQFGLRIANKNVETLAEVKQCINKFKADFNSYSSKEIREMVSLHRVKVLNPNIPPSNSYIDVELHTNSTTIKNGFWLYYFIVFQENKDMIASEPFSLMSYKQLHKRKDKSFLKRHKDYMVEGKESLYPYYFNSFFFFDEDTKSYKLKGTFNFCINYYQKKEIKESNKNSGIKVNMKENNKNYRNNTDMKEDEMNSNDNENYSGSDEVMKDLMSFYPSLNIINLSQNFLQNKNEYPYPSQTYPSPSLSSTSSLLSSPMQIPSKTLSQNDGSIDDFQNHKDLNNDSLTNNGLNISKYYLEFKYNLLLEEKEYLEIILNKITELYIHYSQCFDNNIKTTKDIFYGNYLKNNINYLYQKSFEFIQYSENLDIKINNIINEIQETKNNIFNTVHIQNYNQDNINTN